MPWTSPFRRSWPGALLNNLEIIDKLFLYRYIKIMDQPSKSTPDEFYTLRLRPRLILAWAAGIMIVLGLIFVLLMLVSFSIVRYLYHKAPDPIASYQLNKTVQARMPSWSPVAVEAKGPIPVRLSKVLEADIPFQQDVEVPVDSDFTVPLDVTISIPIDQEIFVETEVPIEAEIPLKDVMVQTNLWGLKNVSLPVSGIFPINITIPFKRTVHIKTLADVRIKQDVTVHVNKVFTLPLDLTTHVSLPVDDVFQVSLPENVMVNARVPDPIPVEVQVDLDLPKKAFSKPVQ